MQNKKIIATGSGGPASINFIDSLRDAPEKISLIGVDINPYHLELPNVDERYLVPRSSDPSYIDKINELTKKTNANFIHPQPDCEVRTLSDNREKLIAKTFLPKKETVEVCQDKYKSALKWKSAGLPVSETIVIEEESDLRKAETVLGYPYWLRASVGYSSRGSTLVQNVLTARHWIGYWQSRSTQWEFIAQQYLPGRIFAFQSIWREGELITSQARERVEYLYPDLAPSGVTNTPVVSVTVHNANVNDVATQAVTSVDPKATGIFCVDLREDKNGKAVPTEINAGRFFTTSYFFTKAGVNMPYFYVKLAFEEEIPKLPRYNAVPKGLYWIRHIDAPAKLVKDGNWQCLKI